MFVSAAEGVLSLLGLLFLPPTGSFGSRLRLFLVVCIVLASVTLFLLSRRAKLHQHIIRWLSEKDHAINSYLLALLVIFFLVFTFLFTWLFLPPLLRLPILWLVLLCLQFLWLIHPLTAGRKAPAWWAEIRLPRWRDFSPAQKKTARIILILGILYFLLFIPPNLKYAEDADTLLHWGGDEAVMYPVLTQLFVPGETFRQSLYHLFIYEDYHYGYPFYVLSALVLLPSRLVFGADFTAHTQLNLLLLRQLISVLPMILTAALVSAFISGWKKPALSVFLFLFLLFMPGVIGYNIRFWHPDSLAALLVALVIYHLNRDRLRLGANFHLAALYCGLANSIRMVGFFFVLGIALYLLTTWFRRRVGFKHIVSSGLIFILLMFFVHLVTSPYLFDPGARQQFIAIVQEKAVEMQVGYPEPDPEGIYRTGFAAWLPFLVQNFGSFWILLLAFLSSAIALIKRWKPLVQMLCLSYSVLFLVYLITGVAVKSLQYMLPASLPLLALAFNLPIFLDEERRSNKLAFAAWAVSLVLLVVQFALYLANGWKNWSF